MPDMGQDEEVKEVWVKIPQTVAGGLIQIQYFHQMIAFGAQEYNRRISRLDTTPSIGALWHYVATRCRLK